MLEKDFIRHDGRKFDELRPIKFEVGILKNANGSAYIEQGLTKIVVAVYGPRETYPKITASPNEAILRARYHMAPFSVTEERKSPSPSRREIEISKVIRDALSAAVILEKFPRTTIDVYIEVLNAYGSTRVASINAAALALADAGIPMRDLVTAVSVGKVNGHIVLDIDDTEDKLGEADIPIAMMPRLKKITLLQMDGLMTPDEFMEALKLAEKGIAQIYELQKNALRKELEEILKKYEEGGEMRGEY